MDLGCLYTPDVLDTIYTYYFHLIYNAGLSTGGGYLFPGGLGGVSTPWSQYYSQTSEYHMGLFKLITETEYTSQLLAYLSYGLSTYFSDIILINIDK